MTSMSYAEKKEILIQGIWRINGKNCPENRNFSGFPDSIALMRQSFEPIKIGFSFTLGLAGNDKNVFM